MTYDVVTLGETMLRLTPPSFQRIEQAAALDLHVGGSESNTAVGLARLGHKVAWLSRMTDNALGRHVVRSIAQQGVCTEHIQWTDGDRVGLYFLESGKPPRGSQVLYDRRDSAMAAMQPHDLPQHVFQAGRPTIFHTTGITLGISATARATVIHAVELAKSAGWKFSFDVNYRAGLWTLEEARHVMEPIMKLADIIFLPLRDAKLINSDDPNITPEQSLRLLASQYPQAIVCMTLGAEGALLAYNELLLHQPAFDTEAIERLGGGDAFSAGFLSRYLTMAGVSKDHLQSCLQWGCCIAAMKYTIPGDMPLVDRKQIEHVLETRGTVAGSIVR